MTAEPLPLEVENLKVGYGTREVFSDLSLQVRRGESVALVGPSGSGKTTLLNAVLGVVATASGTVRVSGADVLRASRSDLARIRALSIGIVFQHGELVGELSPLENVALPALIAGSDRSVAVGAAAQLLADLEVPVERASADQLSGGERQRTALARALINRPALILADEPTGALDPDTRSRVAEVVFSAPKRWHCGLLVVTHDPAIAQRADRVVQLAGIAHVAPLGTAQR